jgi:hypothetical protein
VVEGCEHGNELLDFIEGAKFLVYLSDYVHPKKGTAPRR